MLPQPLKIFLFSITATFLLIAALFSSIQAAQAASNNVTGWAWSSNIGWISFNSNDAGAGGGPYGVSLDSAKGKLSGWAWSSNIGWISFNSADVSGCPQSSQPSQPEVGACSPTVNLTTSADKGKVTGFARACAGTINGNCTGGNRTDGWNGWLELSGKNHLSPDLSGNGGVTYNAATGSITGFAWGGDVVGWLQFKLATVVLPTPTVNLWVVDPVKGDSKTLSVPSGSTPTLKWQINNP